MKIYQTMVGKGSEDGFSQVEAAALVILWPSPLQ